MGPAEIAPPTSNSGRLWPARSRAEVSFLAGERREVQRAAERLFDLRLRTWDYAGLAGAPDDARVELGTYEDQLYMEISDPIGNGYRVHLCVLRIEADLVMINEGFQIQVESMQRKGLGLRIFHRQLDNSKALGVTRIEAVAGRRHDENGYYTWPRFGFDGPLPATVKHNLPLGLEDVHTVLDLMECEKGRLWWRHHGCTIPVAFDLAQRSRSRKVFRRYVRERLKRGGAGAFGLQERAVVDTSCAVAGGLGVAKKKP